MESLSSRDTGAIEQIESVSTDELDTDQLIVIAGDFANDGVRSMMLTHSPRNSHPRENQPCRFRVTYSDHISATTIAKPLYRH